MVPVRAALQFSFQSLLKRAAVTGIVANVLNRKQEKCLKQKEAAKPTTGVPARAVLALRVLGWNLRAERHALGAEETVVGPRSCSGLERSDSNIRRDYLAAELTFLVGFAPASP